MKNIQQIDNNHLEAIDTDNDTRTFYSYGTEIASYNGITHKLTLTNYFDYSKTTQRHLYEWLIDNGYYHNELKATKNKSAFLQSKIDNGEILFKYV